LLSKARIAAAVYGGICGMVKPLILETHDTWTLSFETSSQSIGADRPAKEADLSESVDSSWWRVMFDTVIQSFHERKKKKLLARSSRFSACQVASDLQFGCQSSALSHDCFYSSASDQGLFGGFPDSPETIPLGSPSLFCASSSVLCHINGLNGLYRTHSLVIIRASFR
jgi:hypothetical protein